MTDDPNTTQLVEPVVPDFIDDAIRHGISATEPAGIGDHGVARLVPEGYRVEVLDLRRWSEEQAPSYNRISASFSDVDSFAAFYEMYASGTSIVFGCEPDVDQNPVTLLDAVFDYHPDSDDNPSRRQQHASLVLTRTESAERWLSALGRWLSQDEFLDLIVDGIGEIANPPGADLRELVSDLHSIRKTEAQSVVTTSGATKVVLSENAHLHDGTGSELTMPATMSIVFTPFTASNYAIELAVNIRPTIDASGRVAFRLRCPHLVETMREHYREIAAEFTSDTDATILWQP